MFTRTIILDDGEEVEIRTNKGVEIKVQRSDKLKCLVIETRRKVVGNV